VPETEPCYPLPKRIPKAFPCHFSEADATWNVSTVECYPCQSH